MCCVCVGRIINSDGPLRLLAVTLHISESESVYKYTYEQENAHVPVSHHPPVTQSLTLSHTLAHMHISLFCVCITHTSPHTLCTHK